MSFKADSASENDFMKNFDALWIHIFIFLYMNKDAC